jgi:hypothetical protein
LDGKDAGFEGQGYVIRPWETVDIPGWRRSDNTVAKFSFEEKGGSYVAQTGRGTTNVGVIGLAVYDEKVSVYVPYVQPFPVNPYPYAPPYQWFCNQSDNVRMTKSVGSSSGQNCSLGAQCDSDEPDTLGIPRSMASASMGSFTRSADVKDVGTAYGHEASFYTTSTTFERATTTPAMVFSLRYATRERLVSWGVPIDAAPEVPPTPNPFPMSTGAVPAPSGWRG